MKATLASATCPDLVLDWIAWYPDGGLTPNLRSQIELHAAECASCRQEIANLSGDEAGEQAVAPGADRVFARVTGKIAAHPRRLAPPSQRRIWLVRPRLAIAAGLVVAVISGTAGIIATRQLSPDANYQPATATAEVSSARGPSLDVVFRDDASFAEVSRALHSIGASVDGGPTLNGVVHLQLSKGADALEAAARLESGDLRVAEFAQPAP